MKILGKSRGSCVRRLSIVAATTAVLAFSAPAFAQQPAPTTTAKPPDTKPPTPATPATPAAPAAPPAKPVDAKAAFASGEKKFKAGDYEGALADFEASSTAKADPQTTLYIAKSYDNLQKYAEAVVAYEKLIAENPPKMATEVAEAKKRVEAIKAMPGKVHVETTPPGASIVLDQDQQPQPQTTPTDLELSPGKHKLLIGAEGYENVTKEIDVTFASKQDVKAELVKKEAPPPPPPPVVAEQPPQPPPPPPPPPPEPRSKVPAYVTGAVAIVAAGVGTGFGIKALQQSSDFEKNPTTKKADDGENNALVADMMFGIAITFGVTSAVLFLSSDAPGSAKNNAPAPARAAAQSKKSKTTIIPAPFVSPSGGGAGAVVRF